MVKNPPANAGAKEDSGSIPESRRSPGGGWGNPLQCSCLENPMVRGAWQATVHEIAKSCARLKRAHRERNITNIAKHIFTFILRSHMHFRDILYFALEHKTMSREEALIFFFLLWFLNMNGLRELKFSDTKMCRNKKKQRSPPVGQHSYITHFKIKSETEFWQACYFPQCQEAHNRPFFLDKALKMLGDSDVLSHKTVQILHTHSRRCPCPLFWKQYYIFSAFGRRKEIF